MSLITKNIVHNTVNNTVQNIIYNKHNSFFDLIINSLEYNFFDFSNKDTTGLNFNLLIGNEPISFSQNDIILAKNLHINSLVFFHNPPQKKFKKEDCIILKNNISSSYKVLTTNELVGAWLPSDNRWSVIDYGIVDPGPIDYQIKNKNILILNINNNPNIDQIFQTLKQYHQDIDILNSMPKNLEDLYSLLENYRICIDFENLINALTASVLQCYCITSYFCPHLSYYTHIKNIEDINNCISNIENSIDNKKLIDQKDKILEIFSFDNFNKRLSLLMYSITKEKFLL